MRYRRILGLTFSIYTLSFFAGCDRLNTGNTPAKLPPGWSLKTGDYQFVTSPSGDAYIFQPSTGKISRVTPDGLDILSENTQTLKIGEYYRLPDAKDDKPFIKYLGNGLFEPSKFAVRPTPANSADEILAKYGIKPN